MSDTLQLKLNEAATETAEQQGSGAGGGSSPAVAGYKVITSANANRPGQLFEFRSATKEPPPEVPEQPQQAKRVNVLNLALIAGAVALVPLVILGIGSMSKPKPPLQYIDLGNRRLDAVGLAGRLIARWEGSAKYELYIDPLDPQQAAGFQAVAEDPPHALSLVIRLRDSSGLVACQKQIVLPDLPQSTNASYHSQALFPRRTGTGDTVQNISGADGKVAEITVTGTLPCPENAYRSLAGWDFASNFPSDADQREWLAHENSLKPSSDPQSADTWRGPSLRPERLASPIEGDDVIVGDNPSRGTMDTSGGFTFMIGMNAMRTRTSEWQVFPASIHFRCDKNGACILSRISSHTNLQARLMR